MGGDGEVRPGVRCLREKLGRLAEVRAEAGRGGQVRGDLCKIPDAWGCLNIGERSTDQEHLLQRRWEGMESGTKEEKFRLIVDL